MAEIFHDIEDGVIMPRVDKTKFLLQLKVPHLTEVSIHNILFLTNSEKQAYLKK
jgi:hypothetical protein